MWSLPFKASFRSSPEFRLLANPSAVLECALHLVGEDLRDAATCGEKFVVTTNGPMGAWLSQANEDSFAQGAPQPTTSARPPLRTLTRRAAEARRIRHRPDAGRRRRRDRQAARCRPDQARLLRRRRPSALPDVRRVRVRPGATVHGRRRTSRTLARRASSDGDLRHCPWQVALTNGTCPHSIRR